MNYIHIETGEHPLTESQLLQRFKDISFPEGVFEPEGYALVASSEPPVFDNLTQNLREASPERTPEGWQQRWEVYPLPDEEVDANRLTKVNSLRAALRAEYERRTAQIANPYPPSERESWPIQISEARELLADPAAITPWIDAAAFSRGIDRSQLAARIVILDTAYRTIHGALTGARQRIEGQIDAAAKDLAALAAIDVKVGWPA